MQLLFDHPDERARLQGDLDGLLATAVEEMLRYTSPVVHFRRTAMEDTVVRDQPIAAGDKLMVFYGSGNRDEEVFADPDRFDVGRDPNPHMAFGGGGPHLCLGLHVARIEIAVMLRELLTRAARPRARPASPSPGVELHHRRAHDARRRSRPGRASGSPPVASIRVSAGGPHDTRIAARQRRIAYRNAAITGANASTWAVRAVEVEGDDRLLDAGLGVLAVAADRAPRPCRRRRRSARRPPPTRRGSRPPTGW